MDFAVAAGDPEWVGTGGEIGAAPILAIPYSPMGTGSGNTGQHTVARFVRVEIHAIAADDDLVSDGVGRSETECSARPYCRGRTG